MRRIILTLAVMVAQAASAGEPAVHAQALPTRTPLSRTMPLVTWRSMRPSSSRSDLYAVQNWFAPHPETGRFSGGVSSLIRGDGRGGFASIPAGTSGLLVTGDAKGLATFDQNDDGWPDFIVTRRGNPHLLFLNQGTPSMRQPGRAPAGCGRIHADRQRPHHRDHFPRRKTNRRYRRWGRLPESVGPGNLRALAPGRPASLHPSGVDGWVTRQTWAGEGSGLTITSPPFGG